MGGEGREQITAAASAAAARRRRTQRRPSSNLVESAASTHRRGTRSAQLDAVVGRRIVRRRQHRARHGEVAGGEVEQVGGRQPDVDDVRPGSHDAVCKRFGQRDAARPHVARHHDLRRRCPCREGVADAAAPRERLSSSGQMPRMSYALTMPAKTSPDTGSIRAAITRTEPMRCASGHGANGRKPSASVGSETSNRPESRRVRT